MKTTDREINPEFDYEVYNGTLEVDGTIIDLEPIVATANESDTIFYTLMGKCRQIDKVNCCSFTDFSRFRNKQRPVHPRPRHWKLEHHRLLRSQLAYTWRHRRHNGQSAGIIHEYYVKLVVDPSSLKIIVTGVYCWGDTGEVKHSTSGLVLPVQHRSPDVPE